MFILSADLGWIFWRISNDNPITYELESLPGWFFMNPIAYPRISSLKSQNRAIFSIVKDNSVLIQTNALIVGTQKKPDSDNFLNLEMIKYFETLLNSLRLTSRQAAINGKISAIRSSAEVNLPDKDFPASIEDGTHLVKKYLWDTAITWDNLINADINIVQKQIQVYEELLIDAIDAFLRDDFRRTILYSAISIESFTGIKFDEIINSFIINGDPGDRLRIIQIKQHRDIVLKKDPIFDLLKNGKFSQRLHELSLYVIGKSLLIEDESLYQKANKLYATRNKIAHIGELSSGKKQTFELNQKDARLAIEIALSIMQWFGENITLPIPTNEMIRGNSAIMDFKIGRGGKRKSNKSNN